MKAKKSFNILHLSLVFIILLSVTNSVSAMQSNKVLVFSKTKGFKHKSIPAGIAAIKKLALENNFIADTTTNAEFFTESNLKQYKTVIFLSPTGDILNDTQQKAFEKYIKTGGGFVGIHSATDCEFDWEWYGNLVGAYFSAHPKQQNAILNVVDKNHLSTKNLPKEWKRFDEWYNFKWMAPNLNVLITIDETSYDAGPKKMGANHPMAWYHDFDGGRSFNTALGHTDESYEEPLFLEHLLGGIKYAMGLKK
ncbi:ThuA domain-containing protein [Pedobacter alpinus]|uniref:ThuA domain-containing protein n=1 Tax=Pedobacter alpinus TaxID=1590643 RepID=A0ABW5TUV8_9SPHI